MKDTIILKLFLVNSLGHYGCQSRESSLGFVYYHTNISNKPSNKSFCRFLHLFSRFLNTTFYVFKTPSTNLKPACNIAYCAFNSTVIPMRIRMFFGILGWDPDPLVIGTDPAPDSNSSIIKQYQ
jgi:hypothetical protein